jgi:hypothetical protein
MKKIQFNKDILIRAVKTFIQAFIGSITINSFLVVNDINALKAVLYSTLIGGLSAGLSAIQNMLINQLDSEE